MKSKSVRLPNSDQALLDWRLEVAKLVASAVQGRKADASELWALAVFFEAYLAEGSEGTIVPFGTANYAEAS